MSEPNVYFLYGTDEYAITGRVNAFVAEMGDPTTADMNISRLDARAVNETDLNNAVNAMPFLASRRLIILGNPTAKYNQSAGQKKFTAFLEAVPPTTTLVLTEYGVLKETHWLVKWARGAAEKARAEAFMLPRPREMAGWIVEEARRQGGKIAPQAAARLAEMVGQDTRQAAQEIGKLLTYVDFKRAVDVEDVDAVSVVTAQGDVFAMVDAIGEGDGRKALKMLHRLMDEEDAFQLFGMTVRQFRLLLLAREAIDSGANVQTLAGAIGVAPFVAEKLYKQAARFTLATLESVYRRLLQTDEEVKAGQVNIELALDTLVVTLTRKG